MSNSLCQLAGDWRGAVPAGGLLYEEKRDGWRAIYLRDHTGTPRLYTRNGLRIEGAGHIVWKLGEMERAAGVQMVFDGEFQVDDSLAATKAWCERGWKSGGEAGHFWAFDCLTYADWQAGGGDTPHHARKALLADLAARSAGDGWDWRPGSRGRDDSAPPVTVLPDGWAFDAHDVIGEARRVWANGGEGLMLKDPLAPYRRNRSPAWLKVKAANAHKWM